VRAAKRPYRRAEELRELLVAEGVQLLLESDLADGDAVTFARVFERVERAGHPRVTKGSVLGPGRVWSSQKEFQREVETATAGALLDIGNEMSASLEAATAVLAEADLTTVAGRTDAVRQLCRAAGTAYFTQLLGSRTWKLWVGLWGKVASSSGDISLEGLGASLRRAQLGTLDRLVDDLYRPLAQVVGFRGRAEFGTTDEALRRMAVAIVALTDGMAIHHRLFPEHFTPVDRPTGPGGEAQPWHPFASALEAIIGQYIEPDPELP